MAHESNIALTKTECLSEDEVLAFAGGHLSPARRKEAHRHFDQCDTCQHLLNEAAQALAPTTVASPEYDEVAWSTTFRPGTVVGQRYVVRRFIARGGMGEVYEAFDRELQQRVALKTVTSTACDSPTAVRRLKAEVQLARRVSHRNVCRIYDFGTHVVPATGVPISFLTMEFVEGETLGHRVRRGGALSVEEARYIGRELLQGLKAAHDAGILHRDFKSDNVMLRKEGDVFRPVILDFGLARAQDHQEANSSASHGNLVGTMAYIAPEQLQGKPYSTASDVYSFGVVWFEMLTGELPFSSGAALKFTPLDRLSRPPPAPSSKRADVPSDLDELILSCLRRSPNDRLQTAHDVLERLGQLEARASLPPTRRNLLPLSAAAALLAVAGYLLLTTRPSAPAGVATSVAPRMAAARQPAAVASPAVTAPTPVPSLSAPAAIDTASPQSPSKQAVRSNPATPTNKGSPRPPTAAKTPAVKAEPIVQAEEREGGWENPFNNAR